MSDSAGAISPQPVEISTPPPVEEPLHSQRFKFVDVALIVVVFFVLTKFAVLGFTTALYQMVGRLGLDIPKYPLPFLFMVIVQEGLMLALIVLVAQARGATRADLGLRPIRLRWLLAGLIAMIILIPIRFGCVLLMHSAVDDNQDDTAQVASEDTFPVFGQPVIAGLPSMFMMGFVTPLVEELIFRALLFGWLRRRMPIAPAAIFSSAVFAAGHATIPIGVAALILGVVCAVLYEKSRTLWVPIIVHVFNNVAVMAIVFL